ncbi:GIY-YIG nuclease family protein [Futiania mangrovi]|uniref:GIY-YIG nuclease family protein n=1 Tax=Futiania mangrovi TaxID=2959716 RepID=A0A9J6PBL9_9PROT|nr:GIY-YIG nuclease family protein [Futiania mangrovii]MCP1335136.1 GIY-YIG nuclease family protein [Futiania mangrovii]
MGCVYLITSPSGKQYVGQTTDRLSARWRSHVWDALNRPAGCRAVAHAIRKYGADAFSVEMLHESDDLDELNRLEAFEIAQRGTLAPGGYNLRTGGDNSLPSDETRARQTAGLKKYWSNNARARKRHSDIFKARLACAEERNRSISALKRCIADPEWVRRRADSLKARLAEPEVRQRRVEQISERWADPAFHQRVTARMNAKHPNVFIEGRIYSSACEAARALKTASQIIDYRLGSTTERFRFWHRIPNHNDLECDAVEECWAIMQWAEANPDHENVPTWMRCRA